MNGITPDRNQLIAIMLVHGTHQQQCQACRILSLPTPGKDGFVNRRWLRKQQINELWRSVRRPA